MRVGIDIESTSRMSEKLLEKIATEGEKAYVRAHKNSAERIAALWCVKEATVKMLGVKNISFLDIELSHEKSGRPILTLSGKAKKVFDKLGLKELELSISHTSKEAIAIVIAQ